jgi:hypothetical protein
MKDGQAPGGGQWWREVGTVATTGISRATRAETRRRVPFPAVGPGRATAETTVTIRGAARVVIGTGIGIGIGVAAEVPAGVLPRWRLFWKAGGVNVFCVGGFPMGRKTRSRPLVICAGCAPAFEAIWRRGGASPGQALPLWRVSPDISRFPRNRPP